MLEVLIYTKPLGQSRRVEIPNVRPDDEAWFKKYKVQVSMEKIGGQYAVYADIGRTLDDGDTPDELLVLSEGRSCEDTLAALRQECEAALAEEFKP